jgi:hypothetical protein
MPPTTSESARERSAPADLYPSLRPGKLILVEAKTLVMFAILHGAALVFGTCLVVILARSTPNQSGAYGVGGEDGDGPPTPPRPAPGLPDGGLPLCDTHPARVRVREPVRPGDLWPRPPRRSHPGIEPRRAPDEQPLHASDGSTR